MKARKNYYTKAIRVLETTNSTTGKANMQVQRNAASPATNPTCFCRKKNTVLPNQACSGQQGLREGWTVSRAWPGHELLLDNGTSRTTTRLLHYWLSTKKQAGWHFNRKFNWIASTETCPQTPAQGSTKSPAPGKPHWNVPSPAALSQLLSVAICKARKNPYICFMNKGSHIQLEKVFLFSTFTALNAAATCLLLSCI